MLIITIITIITIMNVCMYIFRASPETRRDVPMLCHTSEMLFSTIVGMVVIVIIIIISSSSSSSSSSIKFCIRVKDRPESNLQMQGQLRGYQRVASRREANLRCR